MAILTREWTLSSRIARLATTALVLATISCYVLRGTGPLQPARAIVIAHRGASAVAPEHTTAAYDRAVQLGADYIELDVQRTKDGVLVVLHDATLDRTARGMSADCTGRVAEKTIAQVERCDAGTWFNSTYPTLARPEFVGLRVPRVADILARYAGSTRLYIETKDPESYPGIEADLVAVFRQNGISPGTSALPRVFLQSFSRASLLRFKALDPTFPLIQLVSPTPPAAIIDQLSDVRAYAAGIGVGKQDATPALIQAAHAACLLVHPYTVNDEQEMLSLLEMGVDGIFTDRPDQLRDVVARAPARPPGESGCVVVARQQ
ncbi:MAG TPA: glycerophosphodiester phosphodiesterase [Gemmatimonadaceae bacterium]|nr:glycerophosphodiester phosphodiesterase [Gemmatimonadaceae bacterium]